MRQTITASLVSLLFAASCAQGELGSLAGGGSFGGPSTESSIAAGSTGGGLGGASSSTTGEVSQGAPASTGAGAPVISSGPSGTSGVGGSSDTSASTGQGGSPSSGAQVGASSTSSNASSSSGGVPTICAQANDKIGCCDGSGAFYYCPSGYTTPKKTTCTSGKVCGWDSSQSYYGCVSPPVSSDPSGKYPMACP